MSRREPMAPVEGLKKPTLPPPTPRPRTLTPVPTPGPEVSGAHDAEIGQGAVLAPGTGPDRFEQPGDEPEKATAARSRTPRAQKTTAPPAARSVSADTMKPVSVSVPVTLAESWRDRARKDRTSQVDVLLDALVAHQSELDELVAASSEKQTVSDGLFDRGAGTKGERYVGVSLRIKAGNLEVIDRLADKHGAVKRSPFVAAVLTAYLR